MNDKKKQVEVVTPWGFISYPSIVDPNTRGEYDLGIHKASLYIKKDDLQTDVGKQMLQAILDCGRAFYGKPSLTLKDFNHPFSATHDVDTFSAEKKLKTPEIVRKGYYHITAKNYNGAPIILGPDKTEWTEAQARKINAGDIVRFVVSVYAYTKGKTGVNFGLQIVQYRQKGTPFGADPRAAANKLDTVEVTAEDLNVGAPLVTASENALALG